MYAIQILQREIVGHKIMIEQLRDKEYEMLADEIFCKEEIKEREEYIRQLTQAINLLKEKL
jgi:hypothetical protein